MIASCRPRSPPRRCRRRTRTSLSPRSPSSASGSAARKLSSTRLTKIYLERLKRFDPQLRCVITLCEEHALKQAAQADREIAAGRYRGPLHGIPWGAKDLLDTAGIATTYGAEPFRHRVPKDDGAVTRKLNEAGAVLVAKLSLGALALNDIWFGGQTMNPWLPQEGSSGSSAGPASATAAGLVAFAIGSETQGSIISPCMRCGTTGLRPTYGRVPRTGAMTLCWTMDKLGPIARSVEDTLLVLDAIRGPDAGDTASVAAHLDYDAGRPDQGAQSRLLPRLDEGSASHRAGSRRIGATACARPGADRGLAAGLALRRPQPAAVRRGRRRVRGADALRRGRPDARTDRRTRGPTCSANRASSPPWISCRPTACAARWRWRWRA